MNNNILAENLIICGIAANILTEIVKAIAKESWNRIKISVKMPDGSKFLSILERQKFSQLMKKHFGIDQ